MCSFYVELPYYVILNLNHAGRRAVEPSKREPSSLCTVTLNPNSLRMNINETMTMVMHTQLPPDA